MRELKIFIVIGAIALFAACTQTASNNTAATNAKPAANATAAPPATPEVMTAAKLYTAECAKCHRDNGVGGKITIDGKTLNPDNLTTDKLLAKTDEKIFGYISDGAPDEGMPTFKDKLKPEQIKDLIKFIRTDLKGSPAKPAPVQPN